MTSRDECLEQFNKWYDALYEDDSYKVNAYIAWQASWQASRALPNPLIIENKFPGRLPAHIRISESPAYKVGYEDGVKASRAWLPIEQAKKDGTEYLFLWNGKVKMGRWSSMKKDWLLFLDSGHASCIYAGEITHFQYITEPE